MNIINFLKNKILPQPFFLLLVVFFRSYSKFGDIIKYIKTMDLNVESSLDLGCGNKISNPFNAKELFGADIKHIGMDNVYKCTLGIEELPFKDMSFDCVTAFDLIEHIPRVTYKDTEIINPFIFLMNEIYRCLKKDGLFLSQTPAFPSPAAFQDPTHVNFITSDTFEYYFCGQNAYAVNYGFKGSFKVIKQGWNGHHLITLLQKT